MRPAIAWCHRLSPLLLVLLGCSSSTKKGSSEQAEAGVADPGTGCVADPSKGIETAIPLLPDTKGEGQICPRGDRDFFAIDVPAESNLLDVSVSFANAITLVTLDVHLLDLDGVNDVANGVIRDPKAGDKNTSVATTFRVPKPGRYYLRVGDVGDANFDSMNSYDVQVSLGADPDTHEPNDTAAQAKPADGVPGYLASLGDVDVYTVTLAATDSLLHFTINNPKTTLEYSIADSTGKVLSAGQAPSSANLLDLSQAAPATGPIFVSISRAAGSVPDRSAESGYVVTLSGMADPDVNEKPVRNDSPKNATCLAGAGTPCGANFSGTLVTFPTQTGYVGSRGDRDVFVVRNSSSTPAVLEAKVVAPVTAVDLALDIVVPDPASPCKADSDCGHLAGKCSDNPDCELSHYCEQTNVNTCDKGACKQCVGSGVCLPAADSSGGSFCGVNLFTIYDKDGGAQTGSDGTNTVATAQPLFNPGLVYVIVHDNQDDQFDVSVPYQVDVRVAPEPDSGDQSAKASERNNFYNPYPIQKTDLGPDKARAKDITAAITAGTAISGYLSYQSDEDWFSFSHPCPGSDCSLIFEYVQPGPSPVRPLFMMRTSDLKIWESWTYTGKLPATAPVTDTFGDGDCYECSFAAKKHVATSPDTYKYYLQVRDVGADHWDFSSAGRYEFKLKSIVAGCPANCSEGASGVCGCFCKSISKCPIDTAL